MPARSFMQADIAADLPANGPHPLCRQALIRCDADSHLFWYQRAIIM